MHQPFLFYCKYLPFVFLFLLIISCHQQQEPHAPYSFFVAGHAYGNPGKDDSITHPRFVKRFPIIKQDSLIKFGVFTGDVVRNGSEKEWANFDAVISQLGLPIHIAAGNHDLLDTAVFFKRQAKTYYSFEAHGDKFIVLDGQKDNYNIIGDQLAFLKREIAEHPTHRSIYIFFHPYLWFSNTAPSKAYLEGMNSLYGRADKVNFWDEIVPLLKKNKRQEFYLFAGDTGGRAIGPAYLYHNFANIHLIGSGMGGNPHENFLIVTKKDHQVSFRLVALVGDDPDKLGKLEDFQEKIKNNHFVRK